MIFNMVGGEVPIGSGFGAGLNFKIIGTTTQPSNPSENTIWINTNSGITGWMFSPIAPESPTNGFVWIELASSSLVRMNTISENEIYICPIKASQYISGAWLDVDMRVYQNGKWKSSRFYLFEPGTGIASGYSKFTLSQTSYGQQTIDSEHIYIKMMTGWQGYSVKAKLKEPIDVTNYSYAYFTGVDAYCDNTNDRKYYGHTLHFKIGSASSSLSRVNIGTWINNGTVIVDLRSVTGKQYLTIQYDTGDEYQWFAHVSIKNIYFV
jgi:hypothetical protein